MNECEKQRNREEEMDLSVGEISHLLIYSPNAYNQSRVRPATQARNSTPNPHEGGRDTFVPSPTIQETGMGN